LNPEEEDAAIDSLADLGRAGVVQKQTGLAKAASDIKIYTDPSNLRKYITFNPEDTDDMQRALARIPDPRKVLISIQKGKPIPMNLTSRQSVARIIGSIQSRAKIDMPEPTVDNPIPKSDIARKPRKKIEIPKGGLGDSGTV
jgi:hypothetical protein